MHENMGSDIKSLATSINKLPAAASLTNTQIKQSFSRIEDGLKARKQLRQAIDNQADPVVRQQLMDITKKIQRGSANSYSSATDANYIKRYEEDKKETRARLRDLAEANNLDAAFIIDALDTDKAQIELF